MRLSNYFTIKSKRVKAPTILQMEALECGAACLAMILAYYGKIVPLEELRAECGVSRDGSRANNVVKAARRYGMTAKGVATEPEHLRDMALPAIIHWNFNHFVVLEGFARGRAYINDPASGRRVISEEEFDQSFTGVVLVIEPGPEFRKSGESPGVLQALLRRARGFETALLFVFLVGLALVVPGIVLPAFLRIFVDYVLLGGNDGWLGALLAGMLLALSLRVVLTWLQQKYLLRLENMLARTTSSKFVWHILCLPVSFFTQRYTGEIASRVAINNRVADALARQLTTAGLDILTALFYLAVMFQYSVSLSSVGLAAALLNIAMLRHFAKKRVDQNQVLLRNRGTLLGISVGGLQVIETLKAGGGELDFFSKWAGAHAKLINSEQEMGVGNCYLVAGPALLNSFINTIILAIGGFEVMQGDLTVGMLVAFQSLMFSFMEPVTRLVGLGGLFQEVVGDIRRLDDVHKYPVDKEMSRRLEEDSHHLALAKLEGQVELKNLTFGYSRLEPPLIDGLNLVIKPGRRVALVGGSGSGKSTVARLVAGLYQPWEGEILLDGKPRRETPAPVLNNSVALVDQDITLFEGTIHDNLALWDVTKKESDLVRAAKDACIHEDITALQGGYQHRVEEGGRNFSGGQRQRLEIARALSGNPSVLIMDEATSALDAITEKLVDEHIRSRGISCLIVAHRLSTIRDCNEIIVLDRGKAVERGTHQQLMALNSLYARLVGNMEKESNG